MREFIRFNILTAFVALTFILSSCEDDKTDIENTDSDKYIVHLRVGTSGETADYILTEDTITSGTITSAGQGVEQIGWRYSANTSKTLLSIGYYADNNAIGYGLDENGELYEKGKFSFETTLDVFSDEIGDGELLAVEVPRSGFADRVFHQINGDDVQVMAKVSSPIYENRPDSLVSWPTALVKRGNKMFVPFYTLHANGSFATPSTDTAFVAVYSYPELEFEQYIKDTRIGSLGIYGNKNGMVQTENGDLYTYSSASLACGFTTQEKPSGILRIKDGEMNFDQDYFFDIENQTNGEKLAYFEYVGDGLAVGRLITDDSGLWSYYGSADVCKLVILDLENQTITPVDGVPLHKGQYAPMLVKDGKVFVNISTSEEAFIYEIDPLNASAVKGAEIKGKEIQNLVHIEY